MNKRIMAFFMMFIMIFSIGGAVLAVSEIDVATAIEAEKPEGGKNSVNMPSLFKDEDGGEMDPGLPNVGISDVNEWTDRKGSEIITAIQRFAQPFTIIIFIGCAILTLIGAFGDSRMISKGIYGMFISVIVYAVIINANTIMDALLNFLIN